MIAIVDYGMGNLGSVANALESLEIPCEITDDVNKLEAADGLVLPGVGAFGDAVNNLRAASLLDLIRRWIAADRPFLGICLGLQLLFDESEEAGALEGLGVLRGRVLRFNVPLKIPHMGWNQIHIKQRTPILEGVPDGGYVYFVHSYYVEPADETVVATTTDYGIEFVSSVARGNLFACQFHPEKSQVIGLTMLRNFGRLCGCL